MGFRVPGSGLEKGLFEFRVFGVSVFTVSVEGLGLSIWRLGPTLTYQTLLFCRVPVNSILGFIIRTCKKVGLGFGRLRYVWDD